MKNSFKSHLKLFLLGTALASPAWAGGNGGTTAVPFLTMGAGARALAMGEAATASANDATALYWNPGALMGVEGQSATFMHAASIENSSYDYAAFARHRGSSAWGASLQYFSAGSIDQTDNTGEKSGSMTPNDVALTGGYARSFNGFGAGASLKYIQSTLVNTARAMAVDGGVLTPRFFSDRMRAGLSLTNLGTKIKYDQESSPLPMTWRCGLEAYPHKGWTGDLEAVAPKGENMHLALGGEYRLSFAQEMNISVRGGYNTRSSSGGKAEGLSAGMGFGWRGLAVDYAFVSHGDLDPSQVISVGYRF